ncbi:MAG: hypothetical protein ACHQYR_03690 [Candidatus Gagatemarchaeaceae archaeon]
MGKKPTGSVSYPTSAKGLNYRAVLTELTKTGLILQSDPVLPNIAGIIAGERIAGSWWGHSRGHEIYGVLKRLDANPDALVTRLVSGKVTYIHRALWSDFLAVATSTEPWQTKDLPAGSGRLLSLVRRRGKVRMDRVSQKGEDAQLNEAARNIESRLLVYSEEFHTETGAHTKVLTAWSHCPKLQGFHRHRTTSGDARRTIDAIVSGLNSKYRGTAKLPWWPTHTITPKPV